MWSYLQSFSPLCNIENIAKSTIIWGMTIGRPTSCTDEVIQKARDYLVDFSTIHEHPFPSIVGMCRVIERARSTVYDWAEDENNEFSDILEQCNELQEMTLLHKGITNEFNSNITKLVLGKHGYHDKQDQVITGKAGGPVFVFNPVGRDHESD